MATKVFRPGLSAISKYEIIWGDWLAPALILVMPFVNFLEYSGYGLFHTESLLVMAVLVGLGLTGSLLITLRQQLRLPFIRWPLFVRPLVFAFFLSLFLDVQPEFKNLVDLVMSDIFWADAQRVLCVLIFSSVVFVIFYAVCHAFKQNAGTVISVIFIVALCASMLLPQTSVTPNIITKSDFAITGQAPRPDLPPIVHIVLDEHIGIEGVPEDVPGGAELRTELKEFYIRNGFRLYGGAFSPYYYTHNSVPNLLNGTTQPYDMLFLSPAGAPYIVAENAWFDRLIEQNFQIRVYQSQYLNFCAGKNRTVVGCTTYPSSGLAIIGQLDMKATTKTRLLINHFSYRTSFARLMRRLLRTEEARSENSTIFRSPAYLAPLWTRAVTERLINDLRNIKRGEAYFAHLLIPHVGYILDENCLAKPDLSTWYNHVSSEMKVSERLSGATRPAGYVDRYVEYLKQVRCSRHILGEIFGALSDAGILDEATIIVHGDHGSRIMGVPPSQKHASLFNERDVIDNFSTLFAIRSPGVPAGYDSSVRTVQSLFAETVLERPPGEDPARVFLDGTEHSKRNLRTPLVEFPFPGFD